MTDDMNSMPPSEESTNTVTPDVQQPAMDEMPTVTITPAATEEATQSMPTELLIDEMATVTITQTATEEVTQIMSAEALAAAPTMQAAPQAAPPQAYEYFGAMTEAVQPVPYPEMVPITPAGTQPQAVDPAAFYAQGQYLQYPAQPGMPLPIQPGTPVPVKKRRTVLWVAITVIALLLIGGGTAFAIVASQRPTNTPTQALQQFCDGYKTMNAQEVYNTFSSASKAGTSLSQMQQAFDLLKSMGSLVKISDCTVSNVQQSGSTATGTITITATTSLLGISSSSSSSISMGLVLENNTWKIDSSKTTMPSFQVPTMPAMPTFPPDFLTPTATY